MKSYPEEKSTCSDNGHLKISFEDGYSIKDFMVVWSQTVWDEKCPDKFLQAPSVELPMWSTCGQHALTKSERMLKKRCFLPEKSTLSKHVSLLANACCPYVHRTRNSTLRTRRNLSGHFISNGLIIRPLLASGVEKHFFVSGARWWKNHLHLKNLVNIF